MNREVLVEHWRQSAPVIAPSMLKCDFGNLQREIELLEAAGARVLHLDVMDGHFVPNLSYGPVVIERIRRLTALPLDAHLMISDPARYLNDFLKAGCDSITFHIEAVPQPVPLLRRIRQSGAAAGLALNPNTPVEAILDALPECDLVLVMSVEPGFGGQQVIPSALDKLRRLARLKRPETLLSIDGGIDRATIGPAAEAGAQVFVAGSAIFNTADYGRALEELAEAAARAPAISAMEN